MKKLVLFLVCSFAMMAAIAQSVNSNTNKDGVVTDTINNAMPDYKGPCACGNPMSADVFDRLLSDIKNKGSSELLKQSIKLQLYSL